MKVRCGHIPVSDIQGRLVRCPGYSSNALAYKNWCWIPVPKAQGKEGFHSALKESVSKEGLRNPVLVFAFPEGDFLAFGTSRYHAVVECGHETIYALVNDHADRYPDLPEFTVESAPSFFKDVPANLDIGEDGANYHYSIERNRRNEVDLAGLAWLKGDEPWLKKEFSWLPTGEQEPSGRRRRGE